MYSPKPIDFSKGWETANKVMNENLAQLQAQDAEARAKGTLVGRYITQGVADGQAFYQIIKENKKTVRVRICTGIGDDYRVAYWGDEATIDKGYVTRDIECKESLNRLFASARG